MPVRAKFERHYSCLKTRSFPALLGHDRFIGQQKQTVWVWTVPLTLVAIFLGLTGRCHSQILPRDAIGLFPPWILE